MTLYIDGDACPVDIKEMVYRAGERVKVPVVVVANRPMRVPRSTFIRLQVVSSGLDVADTWIVSQVAKGDLVVTADIPLAALLVEKGVMAIDPRGELYSAASIGERLSLRNFMDTMRGAGLVTGGPRPLGPRDRQQFAATFDRELTRLVAQARQNPTDPAGVAGT